MKLFNRKIRRQDQQAIQMSIVLNDAIDKILADLRRTPLTVKHDIHRHIPRPSSAVVIAENPEGLRYVRSIDLSYRNTVPVDFPLAFLTGRDEDIKQPNVRFMINLEYNPQDRCG